MVLPRPVRCARKVRTQGSVRHTKIYPKTHKQADIHPDTNRQTNTYRHTKKRQRHNREK